MANNTGRMQEIANRGLQDQLPPPLRARFDEALKRGIIVMAPKEFSAPADEVIDLANPQGIGETAVRGEDLTPRREPNVPLDLGVPPNPDAMAEMARPPISVDVGEIKPNKLPHQDVPPPPSFSELLVKFTEMTKQLPEDAPADGPSQSEVTVKAPSLVPEAEPQVPRDFEDHLPPVPASPEAHQIAVDEGNVVKGGQMVSYYPKGRNEEKERALGRPTGGIGHLMTTAEAAMYPEGTVIPHWQSDEWFIADLEEAVADTKALMRRSLMHPDSTLSRVEDIPPEVADILTNMVFNLGRDKLLGFKKMWRAVSRGDWDEAANEMVDSKWFSDVGYRSKRLVARMRGIKSG